MATVIVVMNRPVCAVFKGWTGPVGRSIRVLSEGMVIAQRFLAPKKTGVLAGSIRTGPHDRWAGGIQTQVGVNPFAGPIPGYALYMEQGTPPHTIRPRTASALSFFWVKIGQHVILGSVRHPGTRANNYLMEGARAAMRSWNALYRA